MLACAAAGDEDVGDDVVREGLAREAKITDWLADSVADTAREEAMGEEEAESERVEMADRGADRVARLLLLILSEILLRLLVSDVAALTLGDPTTLDDALAVGVVGADTDGLPAADD